jgi:hypothetical protein
MSGGLVFEIVIPSLYFLAGILAYASIHHLAYALSPPRDRVHMLFAALCLFAVPFSLFHAQNLRATNVFEFIHSLKLAKKDNCKDFIQLTIPGIWAEVRWSTPARYTRTGNLSCQAV